MREKIPLVFALILMVLPFAVLSSFAQDTGSGMVNDQLCFDCHTEMRVKANFPSRHPLREGRMTCSSCHQHHGSLVNNLKTTERLNDLCLNRHGDKQGPFIFEHAPVLENCAICHDSHGSIANRRTFRQSLRRSRMEASFPDQMHLVPFSDPWIRLACHDSPGQRQRDHQMRKEMMMKKAISILTILAIACTSLRR